MCVYLCVSMHVEWMDVHLAPGGIATLHLPYTVYSVCVAERGKGRQRQAILGEHPSSYSDNGYGQCRSN